MKHISIFGSTGSIGSTSINFIRNNKTQFRVRALVAQNNVEILAQQAIEFNAEFVVIANEAHYAKLKELLSAYPRIEIAAGTQAALEAARLDTDIALCAITGFAGVASTLEAVKHCKIAAIANKESIICAGPLIKTQSTTSGAKIIPVDSEHSAIFQLFNFAQPDSIAKIIITASGGPFRNFTTQQMKYVTIEQALKHPNWSMGSKITIDSATLMNKVLEVLEAHILFQTNLNQIEILVHPQSIIHGLVCYRDGSILAHLGAPDMTVPIAYALCWPERADQKNLILDFSKLSKLEFEQPDPARFEALRILDQVANHYSNSRLIILNAANEVGVAGFLNKKINFLEITQIIVQTLDQIDFGDPSDLLEIIEINDRAKKFAQKLIEEL